MQVARLLLLLSALVIAAPASVLAQDTQRFCQTGTAVFYGNGVDSRGSDALQALFVLQETLQGSLPAEQFDGLTFHLAFNRSAGVIRDFLESAIQDFQTDTSQFWRFLGGLDVLPDALQQKFQDLAVLIDAAAIVNNADLARHVAFYNARLSDGNKVVVVAHSQGNFFANQSFFGIDETVRDSFGIASVANPDSFVAKGQHVTLQEDLLIAAIRLARRNPMPANETNQGLTRDPIGHNFLDAYMVSGSASEAHILSNVIGLIESLPQPTAATQPGIITVTLTWGAQPDVDLHAFEPNGTHVYYADRIGVSGFLDVDDVTGFGPEHYTVDCAKVEVGAYSVGVNYYSGAAPETALVQVQAGDLVRNFTIPLSSSVGSAGDNSPIPVTNVTVTGSVEEGFVFEIR